MVEFVGGVFVVGVSIGYVCEVIGCEVEDFEIIVCWYVVDFLKIMFGFEIGFIWFVFVFVVRVMVMCVLDFDVWECL